MAFIVTCSFPVIAQHTLSGQVKDSNGAALEFLNVYIQSLSHGTTTNEKGQFSLADIPAGEYELMISGVGYDTRLLQVVVPGNPVNVTMESGDFQLDEVTVEAKSETSLLREEPIQSVVIDTKVYASQPSTMIELMNRSAGVRVKQTGGLGSNASLSLNGFQGKAIKYFKDGIPMDYLGAGYNFSLVPVNMLERMEIYKGVLPVNLGADALGGGLNMVSRKSFKRYAEVSYEIASFNTHRLSLNAFYQNTDKHYFAGVDMYFNHSDNNYEVTAPVVNQDLGTIQDQKVNLFHNDFTQYFTEVYGGLTNLTWADELRISLSGFWIDRDNQYGSRMNQPFGASTSRQYSVIPTVRYQKRLLNDRLTVDQFLVANTITVEQVDTLRGTYTWLQEFIPSDSRKGEITTQGSAAQTKFSLFTSRTNMSYELSDKHKVEVNGVYTSSKRVGRDSLGLTLVASGRDLLSVPAYYNKLVVSAGLETKLIHDRLTNNLIIKYFQSNVEGVDGDFYGNETEQSAMNNRWGVAEALKFNLSDDSFLRLSAEAATRLPEQDEVFGDGNLHVSNLALKPERSMNINAGYRSSTSKYSLELNSFYRITRDLILNVPYNFLFNRNENVDNVKGLGVEVDVTAHLQRWLSINGNMTYQDFRVFDTDNAALEGAKLRNTPFFFANLGLNCNFNKLFGTKDRFQSYWFYTFVRQYYLDYIPKDKEPDGFLGLWGDAQFDAPNIIPNQNLHTAGITYYPMGDALTVGLQVKNVFDAQVFDNFKIQNAGRSYHLKLTYILN
ncbi:TonB-dependent receptor [Reichenbachiella sp. 5M10]|uniref:TonB-dependent receptor n=1 Tax=Reichenbachiella sp. 5M10 TaxID=1889772 RepID=UPI0013044419|nr:TonB-dependent receptor [Reichenbachiella sp. 5M10]